MKKAVLALFLVICLSLPALAGLEGKVVVINAGHGGGESGAVGLNGLVERDINLKVALYLRDMLEEAGAIVVMTRTTNVDLDGTDYYSGTRDRLNRLRVGREVNADVYLALHHNANVNRESKQIEVYYMPKYFGPSKELAEYLNVGLKDSMGLGGIATTMSQVVLNHATIPTIIGEASYISNPTIEEWLRKDENLKIQAQGYFNGLKKFFEDGMPVVTGITPAVNQRVIQAQPMIFAKITTDGISPLNPAMVQVRIDNKVVPHEFDATSGLVTAKVPAPLANGPHRLLVLGRNMAGIAAVPLDMTFYVDEKPAKIELNSYPTYVTDGTETVVKVMGQVLDKDGEPVCDGTQVFFDVYYAGYLAEPWVFTRDGYFVNYLYPKENPDIAAVRITAADKMEEVVVDFRSKDFYLFGVVKDSLTGAVLKGQEIKLVDGSGKALTAKTDQGGAYYFSEVKAGKYSLVIDQLGFEPVKIAVEAFGKSSKNLNVELKPVDGGVLMGRKVILNAVVDGAIAGTEPILTALKDKLERAGATVLVVTKGTDETAAVKEMNKFTGQMMISVKLVDGTAGVVYHYPRSEKAQNIAKTLAIGGVELKLEETKSKLVTLANTQSFVVELPKKADAKKVVDGLYQFLLEYFKGVK